MGHQSKRASVDGSFQPVHAAKFLSEAEEPIEWVWRPYLPIGTFVLLAAFMKVGKSTFAAALAVAVAQGRPFLGFDTKRSPVLILALEEHRRDVLRRLVRFGLRQKDPVDVHFGSLRYSNQTFRSMLEFVQNKKVGLVILDTLGYFWTVREEDDNAQVLRQIKPLVDLARCTDVVVLALHHERKSGGEQGRQIRGASSLLGAVDQALLLEERQGGTSADRVLKAVGRYDETPRKINLSLQVDGFVCLGSPEDASLSAYCEKVRAVIVGKALTAEEIGKRVGISTAMVRKVLERLGDDVIRSGGGVKRDPYQFRSRPTNSRAAEPGAPEGSDGTETNSGADSIRNQEGGHKDGLESNRDGCGDPFLHQSHPQGPTRKSRLPGRSLSRGVSPLPSRAR